MKPKSGVKTLLIAGAGGFGREVHTWARQTWGFHGEWRFKGFLDDNPDSYDPQLHPGEIVSRVSDYQSEGDEWFLCAVGNPKVKERLGKILLEKGLKPATLVHPTAVIGRNVVFGDGAIICPGVVLTCDITIGRFVTLNVSSAVGHDSIIGDWSQTSAFCDLTGSTRLGERVFMGSRSTIIPGVSVGDDAVIGAGSVVLRDVPNGQTVFGVPAQPVKVR